MKKTFASLAFLLLIALSLRAQVLFEDSSNYPYASGPIEGQGQWYCYYPKSPGTNVFVTNNILYLTAVSTNDSVGTPTNGWAIPNATTPNTYTYASFTINVSQLPTTANGGYFCQFQNQNDSNDCCHVFIDTVGTVVPGTYRLGIANYDTAYDDAKPANNVQMDLATNTTYNVVILFDSSQDPTDPLVGSTLWVNPSEQDFNNAAYGDDTGPGYGPGFAYGDDTTSSSAALNLIITQIGFSPYINAGISNVTAGLTFDDVNSTNLPVFGVQPQSTTNYSGNSQLYYSLASGADVTYQWYSVNNGMLTDDGVNVIGSTSNILWVNNFQVTDGYYVVATDAYGNSATSMTATNTVDTTPTAPFFPASVTPAYLTNNLFTFTGFTNIAEGTGPLFYQWYFAPTNALNTFSPLAGQTNAGLSLDLLDYTYAGNYYLSVSNTINGGSIADGPTNSLVEIAPLNATILQLHNLMISILPQIVANKSGTVTINSNNVAVSGYVTGFGGFGSTTYSEYYIQDTNGYGIQVYLSGSGNANTPPVGTYVTVNGPVVVYETQLEIEPATPAAITTNTSAPPFAIRPVLENSNFYTFATNGLGTNAILASDSLITFTNVYIYGNKTGGALGAGGTHYGVGGIFDSNSYTYLYFTIGKYSATAPINTNYIEIYQFAYNYTTTPNVTLNPIGGATIPTNCYQLTGVIEDYEGAPEICPSRVADYVVSQPPTLSTLALTNRQITVTWPVSYGSTYSVNTATNLLGTWTQPSTGLGYYPTNTSFADTNSTAVKFYKISSP